MSASDRWENEHLSANQDGDDDDGDGGDDGDGDSVQQCQNGGDHGLHVVNS